MTAEHNYGFCEQVASREEAEIKFRESSDTGRIEIDPEDDNRYREWRTAGLNGPGWYFVGRIYN